MAWPVVFHPEAEVELRRIAVAGERAAITNAVDKLGELGPLLPFPHQSHIDGPVRELRPRAGRSAWRAFYGRVDDTFVIAAIGPEAEVNRRGFARAVQAALERLDDIDGQED